MVTLNLDGPNNDADRQKVIAFHAQRAIAIQAYASLEQALCLMLSHLSGTTPDVAATIFFKITASRSRSDILDKLYRKKHGAEFNLFWNSALKLAGQLDQKRNAIVHWQTVTKYSVTNDGQNFDGLTLSPPNFWDGGGNEITTEDLADFTDRCEAIARNLVMFSLCLSGQFANLPGYEAKWRPVFEQALAYPLPDDHPMRRKE